MQPASKISMHGATMTPGAKMKTACLILALVGGFVLPPQARAQSEDDLVQGAKKEGRVVFWSSMRIDDAKALASGFETKYPFVKVDIFRAGGEQIVNRAIAEHMAGNVTYDV